MRWWCGWIGSIAWAMGCATPTGTFAAETDVSAGIYGCPRLVVSLRDSDEVLVIRSCDGTEIARHTDVTEPTAAAVDHGQMFVSSFDTGAVHRGDEGVIFRDTWFLQEPVAMGWHEEVLWVLGRDGRHFVLLDADGTLLDLIGGPELDRTHDFVRASDDRLYVTTSWNAKTDGRIQVWDPYTRALVGDFGEDLELPIGIDEGPGGWLYVADWGRDRVERFTLDGTLDPSLSVEVAHPRGLAVTADGTIFVAGEEGVLVVPAGEDEATLVRAVRGAQSITVLDP